MKKYGWRFLLTVLGVLFLLGGCQGKQNEGETDPEHGIYQIYYKNVEGTDLVKVSYNAETDSTDRQGLMQELIHALQSQKPDDPKILPAVPAGLEVLECDFSSEEYVVLNFNSRYRELKPMDEILCRAALVLTLTQIPDVEYLNLKVEGEELTDSAGKTVNLLSQSNFVTGLDSESYRKQKNTVLLYLASTDEHSLVEVERIVLNDESITLEKLAMKLLLDGPVDENSKMVIPPTVSMPDISVESGVCYVNFESDFLTDTTDLDPKLIVYAIVNTLTELPEINKVQLMVGGISDVKLKELMSLEEPFVKDLSIVAHRSTNIESKSGKGR